MLSSARDLAHHLAHRLPVLAPALTPSDHDHAGVPPPLVEPGAAAVAAAAPGGEGAKGAEGYAWAVRELSPALSKFDQVRRYDRTHQPWAPM